MRPIAWPIASAGVAAARVATIGRRRRCMRINAVPIPPASPPNQLIPPLLNRRLLNGSSPRCSITQSSFAPASPPNTPAMAASLADAGKPLLANSRPNAQIPASAPRATSTPKLVMSKLPIRTTVGYIGRLSVKGDVASAEAEAMIIAFRFQHLKEGYDGAATQGLDPRSIRGSGPEDCRTRTRVDHPAGSHGPAERDRRTIASGAAGAGTPDDILAGRSAVGVLPFVRGVATAGRCRRSGAAVRGR